jgi:hypothetical protein
MKKILIGLFALLCISSLKGNVFAAETETMLNFEKVEQLPKDSLVAVPVYLNTQGKELNSLQLKIDVTGEIKDLSVTIGSKMPVQEITKKVDEKSIFVSLTSLELGKSWSTKENVELLKVSFKHAGDGEVKLSFDQKETLAGSIDNDKNVLTVGENLMVKIGTVLPVEATQVQEEATPSVNQDATIVVAEEKVVSKKINNNLLIGLIAGSFVAALIFLIYILKNQKKDKPLEPKLPLN